MGVTRGQRLAMIATSLWISTSVAGSQVPVQHERLPPDDKEDLAFESTTAGGDLPAAISTPSGLVRAPDIDESASSRTPYQHAAGDDDASYVPDRDTRKPSSVSYEDPFRPSIAPYKRLHAFDSVGPDYSLHVRDPAPQPLTVGGSADPDDDTFFADLPVTFSAGEKVRIPSVGPDSRMLALHAAPAASCELFRDGAENWFVGCAKTGDLRLLVEVSAPRSAFGGAFHLPDWQHLPRATALTPQQHRAVALVLARAKVSRALTPDAAVERLVAYFRGFAPTDVPPRASSDIYLDLALSKKGVCRHRAFAFLVTALGLGIPARMITNEAHAWVEVGTGRRFSRIDLGGASDRIDTNSEPGAPAHVPRADPFAWPRGSGSSGAQAVARRSPLPPSGMSPPQPGSSSPGSLAPSLDPPIVPEGTSDDRPRSEVAAVFSPPRVRRGESLHVSGSVLAAGRPCPGLRLQVFLQPDDAREWTRAGVVTSDERGQFDASVAVPTEVPLGTYTARVVTSGDRVCGDSDGRSQGLSPPHP